ncbi:MAG: cobalamin biosynthesis protein, partial [Nitrospirota bacterium]|nr:cobalamin biosynthesis protein [Nitrospirota bacterium]
MSSGSKNQTEAGEIAIFYVTNRGRVLAERLAGYYVGADIRKYTSKFSSQLWKKDNTLIFIMATGIVVRTIAPLVKDKKTDPAVIVMDEMGKYVISLLSGHLGGANLKAGEIAGFLGGKAVITTASDLNKLPSIDLWAKTHGLVIENWDMLPKAGTKLLNKGSISVFTEAEVDLPEAFICTEDAVTADMVISDAAIPADRKRQTLYLRPKDLVLGIGCNSGTSAQEIEAAVRKTLTDQNLSFLSLHSIATIDIKKNEPGLVSFAEKCGLDIRVYNADMLNTVEGVAHSHAAKKATGAQAVAEPSALLAAGSGQLLVHKQKIGNVTVAVAKKSERRRKMEYGKIVIVGTGPGRIDHITPYAQKAIMDSDAIVGYGTYLELIQELTIDKEIVSTGMTQEIDRCRKAIDLAAKGKTVAVISGGDPGIYAMAGLVLELLKTRDSESGIQNPEVEVIPGISALNA